MGRVIELKRKAPKAALESLNRVTGLDFHSWPESLLEKPAPATASAAQPPARLGAASELRNWR